MTGTQQTKHARSGYSMAAVSGLCPRIFPMPTQGLRPMLMPLAGGKLLSV